MQTRNQSILLIALLIIAILSSCNTSKVAVSRTPRQQTKLSSTKPTQTALPKTARSAYTDYDCLKGYLEQNSAATVDTHSCHSLEGILYKYGTDTIVSTIDKRLSYRTGEWIQTIFLGRQNGKRLLVFGRQHVDNTDDAQKQDVWSVDLQTGNIVMFVSSDGPRFIRGRYGNSIKDKPGTSLQESVSYALYFDMLNRKVFREAIARYPL